MSWSMPSLSMTDIGGTVGDSSQLAGNYSSGVFTADNQIASGYGTINALGNATSEYNRYLGNVNDGLESTWGKGGTVDQGLGQFGKLAGGISSLASIYSGFKSLSMAEDQLDIQKDQWAMAKGELQHMQNTRKRISDQYKTGSAMAR